MHANNICLKQALKLFKAGLKIRVIKSVLKLKSQPMTLIFIRNSGPLQCIDNLRSWGEPRGVQPCRCPCVVVNCLSADQEAVYFIKCNWIEIMQFRSWHIMCTLLQFNWPKCPRRGQLNFKGIRTHVVDIHLHRWLAGKVHFNQCRRLWITECVPDWPVKQIKLATALGHRTLYVLQMQAVLSDGNSNTSRFDNHMQSWREIGLNQSLSSPVWRELLTSPHWNWGYASPKI